MIADAGKRYTLVPEETIPSKAKSVKSLTSFAKRSAQLAAGLVCAIALAAGVPTVAGAQVLTTDNVCGKTADARGITAENLPDIDATNALVMGKDGTVYYARSADEQVKIASITKVMTAILTVENCKMDEKVTVSNAAATVGNSTAGLLEGDELTVEQALRGLMIPSGNDAAIVLAEYVGKKIDPKTKDAEATFVKAMNERAKKLGCTGTLFENPHGLDFDEWAGDMHSTAHDVALMMQEAMKNDTIREVVASEDSWIEVTGADGTDHSHSMDTHNYLLGQDGNIGGKTGTTNNSHDAWFCGYAGGLVAVSWMGYDNPKPLGARETGGGLALPVWIDFMKAELKGVPEYTRVMPSSVVERDGEVFYRDPVKGAAGAFSDLLMSGRDEASELVRDQIF